MDAEIVRDQPYQLNMHKTVMPDGTRPRVLKELVDVTVGPLENLGSLARSLLTGLPSHWPGSRPMLFQFTRGM